MRLLQHACIYRYTPDSLSGLTVVHETPSLTR